MRLFQLALYITIFAVLACLGAYLLTRQKKYLQYALKIMRVMVIAGLIFFGVMVLQRIV